MRSGLRRALIGVVAISATACLVSIDESKLQDGIKAGNKGDDDDDDDVVKRDAGKKDPPADAGFPDVIVQTPPVEAGIDLAATCKELQAKGDTTTGPKTIAFQAHSLMVYCDQAIEGGGWTMLHRLSAGQAGDPLTIYNSFGLNDTIAAEITPKKSNTHYTSRILNHWNVDFPVKDALVQVYDAAGTPLKFLRFDATSSTFTSFFRPERLAASSWIDLQPAGETFSDFTLEGSNDIVRRFNVNRQYKSCDQDYGWLVAHGTLASPPCNSKGAPTNTDYEVPANLIRIYLATGTTGQLWKNMPAGFTAGSLAVFAR